MQRILIPSEREPANAGTDLFITGVFDWTIDAIDRSGVAREAAWTDGGVNDICPVGFSVPTKEELMVEITKANITNTVSAFSSFLKLPVAGRRLNWYGKFQGISSITSMWSRSASDSGLSSHSLFVDSPALAILEANADDSLALVLSSCPSSFLPHWYKPP
jgi:hypothetical protein